MQGTGALGAFEALGSSNCISSCAGATGAVGNTTETGGAKVTPTVSLELLLGRRGNNGRFFVETGLSATSAIGTVTVIPSIEVVRSWCI